MNKILMVCGLLMVSTVAFADDITVESCADGAGTVVIGAVSGHKYCKSNETMNWWNAWSWCDAQGKKMFSLDDCRCDEAVADCAGRMCSELVDVGTDELVWTAVLYGSRCAYYIRLSSGKVNPDGDGIRGYGGGVKALCL